MPRIAAISSILLLAAIAHVTMATSILDLHADAKTNLTTLKWAHRVNSQADLTKALESNEIAMLEGDVIIGRLNNQPNGTDNMVIMGHPPNVSSDLSLEEFIKKVTPDKKKGIKLDFKTIEAFEMGLPLIQKANLTIPLWLNADIVHGPVNANNDTMMPVNPKRFFAGAAKLPQALLSIGWTTRLEPNNQGGSYTAEHINDMVKQLTESKTNQSVTYPVRACYAANDVNVLNTLLTNTKANNPTLTIWSSDEDKVDAEKLSHLIKTIGVDKVYVDVPSSLWKQLNLSSSASTAKNSLLVLLMSIIAFLFTSNLH